MNLQAGWIRTLDVSCGPYCKKSVKIEWFSLQPISWTRLTFQLVLKCFSSLYFVIKKTGPRQQKWGFTSCWQVTQTWHNLNRISFLKNLEFSACDGVLCKRLYSLDVRRGGDILRIMQPVYFSVLHLYMFKTLLKFAVKKIAHGAGHLQIFVSRNKMSWFLQRLTRK